MLSRCTCTNRLLIYFLIVFILLIGIFPVIVWAGPFDALERVVMPGPLSTDHAKYENNCDECHKSFDKAGQDLKCAGCHKNIGADLKNKKGYHGKNPDMQGKLCRVCHTEHKGRQFNIILLDKEAFNHSHTDFPLRGGHQGKACAACHLISKKFNKVKFFEAPGSCYDCHKKLEPHQGNLGKECEICHRETQWQDFIFSHKKTDFLLEGKHAGVGCRDCHHNERYKSVPKNCSQCHRQDDKHKGKFSEKCQNCHNANGWHFIKFDHDKSTKFKLTDKHKTTTCEQCHKGENIYKEKLTADCHQCHKNDDTHRGRNGTKCQNCHHTEAWKKAKFDHDKTNYPLHGKHKKVACTDCHRGEMKDKIATQCINCHRQDDAHQGQQGTKCESCHDEEGWRKQVSFDHGLTSFPLLGAHESLTCEQCHVSTSFKDAKKACSACHDKDDYHKKSLGPKCEMCHFPSDWKRWAFDHDKQTKYKLDGAHKNKKCITCHRAATPDKVKQLTACINCHSNDDVHGGSYGRFCDRCHTTESFEKLKQKL